ncbi:hypothetical protein RJT34_14339 [Clitoria ternatea]|uniref:Myosin motor domain-containing protein n=1 Tax=Clitoria ternatea TaxID=43366 RepID=A0AAN9JSU2_CLITE
MPKSKKKDSKSHRKKQKVTRDEERRDTNKRKVVAVETEQQKETSYHNVGLEDRFRLETGVHSLGVMEAITISCEGYPTRKTFDEFVDRFSLLAPEALDRSSDEVTACKKILRNVGLKGYQIGKPKLFLRAGQMAELDTRRSEILGRSAGIIQRKVRSYLALMLSISGPYASHIHMYCCISPRSGSSNLSLFILNLIHGAFGSG